MVEAMLIAQEILVAWKDHKLTIEVLGRRMAYIERATVHRSCFCTATPPRHISVA
jgi:hypothetical protein